MALMKKTQRSFAGGQIDKDLTGRQDLNRYSQGCLALENFKVRKQGNVIKRAGTDLAADLSALITGTGAKLIPLVQERERGLYVLLAGRKAYLLSRDGVRLADGMWSRSPTAETALSEPVPFDDADLPMLDHCQSGDTLFFAHRSYPPGKLVYADGKLAYARILFRQGQGTPPRIKSVTKLGDKWTGTGGTVHLEYAVTAVKDGVETGMSVPFATDYNAPWDTSGSIRIDIDTEGLEPGSWDCFYVYKKEADVFGLIGTTSRQTAFVDVADGFSVSGDLFPEGFTEFDKPVHLRESGNRFASVWKIASQDIVDNSGSTFVADVPDSGRISTYIGGEMSKEQFLDLKTSLTSIEYSQITKTRSATAQIKASAEASYSFRMAIRLSRFRVAIGSILHNISKTTTTLQTGTYYYYHHEKTYWEGEYYLVWYKNSLPPHKSSATSKWVGTSTDFSASPAKFYRARLTFSDGTQSEWIDAEAAVDQTTFDKTGWAAVEGQANVWRRTYAEDDLMYSYDGADKVIERMDAKAPSVGATVSFEVPEAHAAKAVTRIEVAGFADEAHETPAEMIVNGLACYQSGRFVGSFTDDYITPDLTITPPKAEDHFFNPGEYPGCVALYSQRLVYAASTKNPFTFWMSCTGDLYNFDSHEYVRASDAITASTSALSMPRINRMLVHRDLMLFAEGGEWQVAPSTGNAVAPSTIAAKLQSVIGCASWLKPIPVDSDIIFCDSSGETLMATRYNFATDGYESSNLSVLSQRIFRNNAIRSMAYVQFPESTVECVLADGSVASLVYMKEHDVCAWSLHRFGGGWKAQDVAANKALVRGTSDVLFLCRREVSSTEGEGEEAVTSRRAEWAALALRDIDPDDRSLAANLRMDAVRSVTVARTGSDVCAVDETEPPEIAPPSPGHGETVVKVGEVREETDGIAYVTGDVYAVGCAFTSSLKTTSPEFTDQETAQMEIKNATESEVRVIDGSDFTVRQPEVPSSKATLMKVPCTVSKAGKTYTLVPGDADCRLPLVGTNTTNGSVVIEHDSVLPLAILSVSTAFRIEYSNHANGGSGNGRG